jgi:hypothetical protein
MLFLEVEGHPGNEHPWYVFATDMHGQSGWAPCGNLARVYDIWDDDE